LKFIYAPRDDICLDYPINYKTCNAWLIVKYVALQ